MPHNNKTGNIIDIKSLPDRYPTHEHEAEFWECLGRTVATFGFLENVLARAIFSFTATKPYQEDEIEKALNEWQPKLEKSLSDQLGALIYSYKKAVEEHPDANIDKFDDLVEDLKKSAIIRNVLCHGFWKFPDADGASVPFFVNKKLEIFETPINKQFLVKTQTQARNLSCEVINTVTHMGWQFPGSNGPGEIIWKNN